MRTWHPTQDIDTEMPWRFGDIWSYVPPTGDEMPVGYQGWWVR